MWGQNGLGQSSKIGSCPSTPGEIYQTNQTKRGQMEQVFADKEKATGQQQAMKVAVLLSLQLMGSERTTEVP